MTISERDRARKLLDHEDRINERNTLEVKKEAEESRIQLAIRKIKAQDREVAAEQARKEAAAEAEELAAELHRQGEMLQDHAEEFRSEVEGYAGLRARLMDANRRAGMDVGGRWARTSSVLAPWFRSVFGGRNSLVEVPGEQAGQVRTPNQAPRALPERDALAAPRTDSDDQA